MKKTLFLIFLLCFGLCFSCKNPFVKELQMDVSEDDGNLNGIEPEDSGSDGKVEDGSDEKPLVEDVKIFLNLVKNDTVLDVTSKGAFVSINVLDDFDFYEWNLGNAKIGNQKKCSINFEGYARGVYPVVLYAKKGSLTYSAVHYVNFDGKKIVEPAARTVMPKFENETLKDIEVSVFDVEGQNVCYKKFENYDSLKNEKFVLKCGSYAVKIFAGLGNVRFEGNYEGEISVEKNVMTVNMQACDFEEKSGKGAFEFRAYLKTDLKLYDASVFLYKKIGDRFVLSYSDCYKNGNLLFYEGKGDYEKVPYLRKSFEEIDSGIYWLRIDVCAAGGKKGCYGVEYVYVSDGMKSEKVIELCDFYDLFDIKYELNGGFYVGNGLIDSFSSFDTFDLPDASEMFKCEYEFSGWYYDENLTMLVEDFSFGNNFASDLTLNAGWKKLDDDECVEKGCGLLDESEISVCENKDSLKVLLKYDVSCGNLKNLNADLFILSVYDSEHNLIPTKSVFMTLENEGYCFDVSAKLNKDECYLIEITALKNFESFNGKKSKEKIFVGKQVLKAEFNH